MATIIRDDQVDKALDDVRVKKRPVPSRAEVALEILRQHLHLKPKEKKAKS